MVVSGSSSVMTLILRSYLNRVSILLSPYLFTYPRAMPRTLFFILCIGPPMFPKPISLRISVPSSKVLLYHVVKISYWVKIYTGLNLHLDKQDGWSQKFNDSLCQYNFTEIIDSPMHIHSHILDVVCERDTFSKAVCAMVTAGLSDHLAITFSVNIPIKAPYKLRQVNTQKIHKINITDFREDILNSDLIKHAHTTASLLSHQYFNTLCNILDKHAPIKRKMAPWHPDKGFVNSDILSAKRLKRKCERVWRSNKSAINRSRY